MEGKWETSEVMRFSSRAMRRRRGSSSNISFVISTDKRLTKRAWSLDKRCRAKDMRTHVSGMEIDTNMKWLQKRILCRFPAFVCHMFARMIFQPISRLLVASMYGQDLKSMRVDMF